MGGTGELPFPPLVYRPGKRFREHVLRCAGHREKGVVIIAELFDILNRILCRVSGTI